ncbi:MAG: hypothetical protein IPM80_14130 [Proteobacteria bacterium]|nr:hypothetical protein [Pseudomonadota bacterium]
MSEALLEPPVRSDDRLLLTIVIAAAVHVMVVLGVRLPPDAPVKSRFSAMEVVLVPAAVPGAPVATNAALTPAAENQDEPPLLPMPPVEKPEIKAAPAPVIAPVRPAPTPRVAARPAPKATPKPRRRRPRQPPRRRPPRPRRRGLG